MHKNHFNVRDSLKASCSDKPLEHKQRECKTLCHPSDALSDPV